MSERTYTEEEVAAIYARAAEHQRSGSTRDLASPGLTLAEVEQAGREAGLDPASVRSAAAHLDRSSRFPTRATVAVAERWVDAPVAPGAWEDFVASLRHQFGTTSAWWGTDTSSLGEAQEWTHTAASGTRTTVTLSPREERTLVRVVQEGAGLEDERTMGWLMAAVLALAPAMLAGGFVAEVMALGDVAGVAAVVLVLLVGTGFGGQWLAARERTNRARRADLVQHIADDLVRQLGADLHRPAEQGESESPELRLDLPEPDESSLNAAHAPERRRATS